MLHSDHSAFFGLRVSTLRVWGSLVGFVALGFATGCSPKIGDKCTVSTDCSATGDRLCDITEPGGYCTVFNCEPDSCPDDAACINFGTTLSVGTPGNTLPGCTASQGDSPYQRSFCMASCESDSDCRGGYQCVEPEAVGGVKADANRSTKVCAVKTNVVDPMAAGNSAQVCLGSDAGPPLSSSGGSGGASGADGGANVAGESSGGAAGASSAGAGG